MQICYLLGTIALLLLTNQFVLAEVGKAASSTSNEPRVSKGSSSIQAETEEPSSSKDGVVEPKSGPQVSKGVGATEKPLSKQKVESSKADLKPSGNIRPSSDSGDREKSTKPTEEATASNTNENDAAQQIKTTETAEITKTIITPAVSNIKAQPEVTAEGPNVKTIKPSRILVMLPMPLYSHTQNYMPIFKELAKRGHHVTVVSPFPQNMTSSNWEEITVPNILSRLMAFLPDPDFSKQSFVDKIFGFMMLGVRAMNMTLQMKPVADLWNDDAREFDLVFVEAQFIQEPLVAFGHKFKAPVIALFPGFITPEVAYYTGNPLMTMTYVPNMFFPFSNSMSFLERGMNSAFNLFRIISYNLWTIPRMDELIRQYLPSKDLPYVGDMLFNMSFTFMDTHHVLSYPFPRVNNMRGFLGINTKPTSNLSQELQEYMDGGEDGVLFFTLGSHFQTSTLRPHILEALLGAFSRIPNKVLMKWDKEEPPAGLPPNVKTQKWFPQSAILAHKNCIGFITHTGVHGLVESLDHAVPVISVPLFADQHFFAKWVREKGVGLSIDVETVTPEIAYQTINEVITNRKYKENAFEVSKLMKDLPLPTLDEITYWTEYVIRTKGAPLLRSGALNLAWYQRFGLDLLAVAVTAIVVPIWLMIAVLKCLVSMCRRNRKPEKGSNVEKVKSKTAKKRD